MRIVTRVLKSGYIMKKKVYTSASFTKARSYVLCRKHKVSGKIQCLSFKSGYYVWCERTAHIFIPHFFKANYKDMGRWDVSSYRKQCVERADAMVIKYDTNPEYEVFKARVGSKKCPVKIDWHKYHAGVSSLRDMRFIVK